MFSKSKITDQDGTAGAGKTGTGQAKPGGTAQVQPGAPLVPSPLTGTAPVPTAQPATPKAKPSPSLLSSDLTVKGNVSTSGDIQVEGTIEGDVRAHLLTVGESATIRGEVIADDVVVNGRVVGRLRGLKVRLTSTSQVEGDIVHKTIAIESGAHFEGSVQRSEDPLGDGAVGDRPVPTGAAESIANSPHQSDEY